MQVASRNAKYYDQGHFEIKRIFRNASKIFIMHGLSKPWKHGNADDERW